MIYLDNAATSFPKPEAVYRTVDHVLRNVGGNAGRGGHRLALEAARVIFEARESLARLIRVSDSARIVFTKNATESINLAVKGLGLKADDGVVSTTFEHNSLAKAVGGLSDRGITVTLLAPDNEGFLSLTEIEKAIRGGGVRLLAISHASNVFGTIADIEAIGRLCRKNNVIFMVDAAQTTGALSLDVSAMNIDILASTGHKSLFGPQGTGFLYVREGIELMPLLEGGTGDAASVLEMPERLEAGTLNTPGLAGLAAGVDFVLNTGIDKIRAHEAALMEQLMDGLNSIKGCTIIGPEKASERVSLITFNIKGLYPVPTGLELDNDYSIMVRCGTHCSPQAHSTAGTLPEGGIRVSPGFFTKQADIEELLRALRTIVRDRC
ncbi:MAG: aminotransferase class V-fold PLP-dependent enzyme [Thermodesulfobacteriota bacterium]